MVSLRRVAGSFVACALLAVAPPAQALTAPVVRPGANPGGVCGTPGWVGAWMAAPSDTSESFAGKTIRNTVRPHISGGKVRIRLSNRLSNSTLSVGAVKIGQQLGSSSSLEASPSPVAAVTFSGSSTVQLTAYDEVWSDPITFPVDDSRALAIDVHVVSSGGVTRHEKALRDTWVATGNQAGSRTLTGTVSKRTDWSIVSAIDVEKPAGWSSVVAFGDSATDGTGSSGEQRYADWLQQSFKTKGRPLSVLNAGIAGNRLMAGPLFDGSGQSGLSRFDFDVLQQSGVSDVIILLGGNDLGNWDANLLRWPRASDLFGPYEQLIKKLHRLPSDPNVILATYQPTGGALVPTYGETWMGDDRRAFNAWVRDHAYPHPHTPGPTSSDVIADRFLELAWAIDEDDRDIRMVPDYNSGDSVHPNGAGYGEFIRSEAAFDTANLGGQWAKFAGARCG